MRLFTPTFSSVSVKISNLAKQSGDIDYDREQIELELPGLLEVIRLQPSTGPAEAARSIYKNIKHGSEVDHQLRSLIILESLILNSGKGIGSQIANDRKLLSLLKGILHNNATPECFAEYDIRVRNQVRALAIGWKSELKDIKGFESLQTMWKFVPNTKNPHPHSRHKVKSRSSSDEDAFNSPRSVLVDENNVSQKKTKPPPRPTSPPPRISKRETSSLFSSMNSSKNTDKKKKRGKRTERNGAYNIPQINYKVEAPKIRLVISDCQTSTSSLSNILLTLSSSTSPLDNSKAMQKFNHCRSIRRKVLRYLQYVGAGDPRSKSKEVLKMDEEFLGSLIDANDQLVSVFQKWDTACGYSKQNPSPNYEDTTSSDDYESYYSSSDEDSSDDTSEEESVGMSKDREESTDISKGINKLHMGEVPKTMKEMAGFKPLEKVSTENSVASDPFGDKKEAHSRYL